jgi:acetyltransferase-like isoleucine patch superfamily enzyme
MLIHLSVILVPRGAIQLMSLESIKMKLAYRINNFMQYWYVQNLKRNKGIDPTVVVMSGNSTVIGPNVTIGRYTYLGANVVIESGTIGAFCSIASGVNIGRDEHPVYAVSTHPFWYSEHGFNLPTEDPIKRWDQTKNVPVIGNDVWLGAGVHVLRGAVIEDGAIIGAGSVVTGHIPSYAIAVGAPAKVIKYRFDEQTREQLLKTEWWNWDESRLKKVREMFASPHDFIQLCCCNTGYP